MKKISIVALAIMSLTTTMHADLGQAGKKDISVVPATQVNSGGESSFGTQRGKLFNFAQPAAKTVNVGEPITVALKLKERAYIYLIAVSNKSNKAYMILPNRFEGYNNYKAHTHYVIPERSADYRFVSDAPGTETLYVIASTYKQSFDQLLNQFGKKEVGGFRISSAKSAQKFMKDILVVPARTNKAKVEVRKLNINVAGHGNAMVTPESDTRVFLSSGKTHYKLGDIVTIKYEADDEGYVYLMVVNPDGSANLMNSRYVEKNKNYTLEQRAAGNRGEHLLLAYFSAIKLDDPAKTLNTKNVNKKTTGSKDLVAVSSSEHNAKNQHIIIIE